MPSKGHHRQALLDGLGDSPVNFTFTGLIVDLSMPSGSCVCGHPIRYEFYVQHNETGMVRIVGSTCIEYFEEYNPDEGASMKKAWKEYVQERKELEAKPELDPLVDEYKKLWVIADAIASVYDARKQRMPYQLFMVMRAYKRKLPMICDKEYNSSSRVISWYKKNIEILKSVIEGEEYCTAEQAKAEIDRIEVERKLRISKYSWIVKMLEKVFSENKKGEFIPHMIQKLEAGDDLINDFSIGQRGAIKDIFAKQFGKPKNFDGRYERAIEYFDLRIDDKIDTEPEDYIDNVVKEDVHASDGIETDGLPF